LLKQHRRKSVLTQFASFTVVTPDESGSLEPFNRFLRGHMVVQIAREMVRTPNGAYWSLLVEYLDGQTERTMEPRAGKTARVDYKTVLSPEDFAVFSRLREARKKLSEERGLPVYAVLTNEQLAEIARKRPASETELKGIDGIGDNRATSFGPTLLAAIPGKGSEGAPENAPDRVPF
jgi:superfamily II DNA helicase RecQ